MIAPPYTAEFINLFLPLIENDGITGTLRSDDGNDPVSEFICKFILQFSELCTESIFQFSNHACNHYMLCY